MHIKFLSTGGTIDKIYFDAKSDFEIGDSVIGFVLDDARVDFEYEVQQLMRKDSLDMTDADRRLIRETIAGAPGVRFIVTHGTDTMTDTAHALEGISDKVIVLTGALNPARFKSSDAIFNIGLAVSAVQTMSPGVYIAMNTSFH